MLNEETTLDLDAELPPDQETTDEDDVALTSFLDTEENVEEYLLEALSCFAESDYEEDMRWDHPEASPGMFVDHGGIILRTEIDGEEAEYRITIERV